jgi:hypothetical protein
MGKQTVMEVTRSTNSQSHDGIGSDNAENPGECMHGALLNTGDQNGLGNERGNGEGESGTGRSSGGRSASAAGTGEEAHESEIPQRTLSPDKSDDVGQIWRWAEERLRADRRNFSLVHAGHKYLPHEGRLDTPAQLFEIRWRGLGGGKTAQQSPEQDRSQEKQEKGDRVRNLERAIRLIKSTLRTIQETLSDVKGGMLDQKREKQEANAEQQAVDI